MTAHYTYRYGAVRCSECGADWTAQDAVRVELVDNRGRSMPDCLTRLTADGAVVDTTGQVWRGYHSRTVCDGCDASLYELTDEHRTVHARA